MWSVYEDYVKEKLYIEAAAVAEEKWLLFSYCEERETLEVVICSECAVLFSCFVSGYSKCVKGRGEGKIKVATSSS